MTNAMPRPLFSEKVIKLALAIPPGRVTTYGRLSKAAGSGNMASQSISGILGKAEAAGVKGIPWHRIVYSGGRIWVNDQQRAARMKLYKKEGIKIDDKDRVVDFDKIVIG